MKLYSYFRSSASYRLRIALNLKGLQYDYQAINLLAGEQQSAQYLAINPLGLVPTLQLDNGDTMIQSAAIVEYLEETHPEPALLPADPMARARVRAVANVIACEIQPLCNIGVTEHLKSAFDIDKNEVLAWFDRWMARGFSAVEHILADAGTPFASGDTPGLADIFLVPQVYNARRFDIDLAPYPTVIRIADACNALPAFTDAAPEHQPDAVQSS